MLLASDGLTAEAITAAWARASDGTPRARRKEDGFLPLS